MAVINWNDIQYRIIDARASYSSREIHKLSKHVSSVNTILTGMKLEKIDNNNFKIHPGVVFIDDVGIEFKEELTMTLNDTDQFPTPPSNSTLYYVVVKYEYKNTVDENPAVIELCESGDYDELTMIRIGHIFITSGGVLKLNSYFGDEYKPNTMTNSYIEYMKDYACSESNRDIYVSDDGSDEYGDGSDENPYLSIQYAIDQIPKNLNHTYNVIINDMTRTLSYPIQVSGFFGEGSLHIYSRNHDMSSPNTNKEVDLDCSTSVSGFSVYGVLLNTFIISGISFNNIQGHGILFKSCPGYNIVSHCYGHGVNTNYQGLVYGDASRIHVYHCYGNGLHQVVGCIRASRIITQWLYADGTVPNYMCLSHYGSEIRHYSSHFYGSTGDLCHFLHSSAFYLNGSEVYATDKYVYKNDGSPLTKLDQGGNLRVYGNSRLDGTTYLGGGSLLSLTKTSGNLLRINTPDGTLELGPDYGTTYCYYSTSSDNHWFNKPVRVAGEIYAGLSYNQQVWHAGNFTPSNYAGRVGSFASGYLVSGYNSSSIQNSGYYINDTVTTDLNLWTADKISSVIAAGGSAYEYYTNWHIESISNLDNGKFYDTNYSFGPTNYSAEGFVVDNIKFIMKTFSGYLSEIEVKPYPSGITYYIPFGEERPKFTLNAGGGGYKRFTDGFIIQWGRLETDHTGFIYVPFPTVFPNQAFNVQITEETQGANGFVPRICDVFGYATLTKNGFTYAYDEFNYIGSNMVHWIAIGY